MAGLQPVREAKADDFWDRLPDDERNMIVACI